MKDDFFSMGNIDVFPYFSAMGDYIEPAVVKKIGRGLIGTKVKISRV